MSTKNNTNHTGTSERKVPVETYSRVVGYFRPVNQWNKGKKEEFRERKTYNLDKIKGAVYEKTD